MSLPCRCASHAAMSKCPTGQGSASMSMSAACAALSRSSPRVRWPSGVASRSLSLFFFFLVVVALLFVVLLLVVFFVFLPLSGLFDLAIDEFGQVVKGLTDLRRRDAFFIRRFNALSRPFLGRRRFPFLGDPLFFDFFRNPGLDEFEGAFTH